MWALALRGLGALAGRGAAAGAARIGASEATSARIGQAAEKGANNMLSNAQHNRQQQAPRGPRSSGMPASVTDIPSYRSWGE